MTCSEAVTRSVESLIRAAEPLVTCLEAVSSSAESLVRAAEPLVIYFQAVACAVEPCAVEIFFALPMVTGGGHERTAHWNVMANAARTCRLACWPPRKLPPLLGELACVDEDDFGSGNCQAMFPSLTSHKSHGAEGQSLKLLSMAMNDRRPNAALLFF